jgi:NAD(P)-dependent dehydrogenase (short-subunit alcohol dehydrogenase family)
MTSTTARHVLITGASTGIGRACAIELARQNFSVFAGVRRQIDGSSLRDESNGKIQPVTLDVTDPASIAAAIAEITSIVGADGLCGLVNNAGITVVGPVEFVSMPDWRRQFEVNFFSAVALAQAALPLLRLHVAKNGRGSARLVNMSSIAGRLAQPILGPYTASKHAMESLTDSLRFELAPQGIQVCSINPGAIDTPIWDKAKTQAATISADHPSRPLYGSLIDSIQAAAWKAQAAAVPADRVAAAVLACMTKAKPRTRYFVGPDAKGAAILKRFLPDRVMDALLRKMIGMAK